MLDLPIDEIIIDYQNGINVIDIGKKYNCSNVTIYKKLKENDINVTKFKDLPIKQIIEEYNDGMSTYDIGKKYNCSNVTISNRLKENGIDIIQFTDLPVEQIIKDYNDGMSTHKLAVKYNCSDVMILDRLKRNNIHIRSLYEITTMDLPTQNIIDDYNNDMSTRKIGEKYGCDAETIRKTLKNNDIKLRSTKEAMNILSIMICSNCQHEYEGKPSSQLCSECNSTGYCYKFDKDCREHNREKYDRKCFFCDELEGINERHCVHHVDYNKNQGCDDTPDWKLVPLCRICHGITGGGKEKRELWKARILWLLNNI